MEEERIISLLVSFLGEYSKQCGEWYSFNCPRCAEEQMGMADDKYNLEVNVNLDERGCGGFHCWKCGDTDDMRGSLTKLFRLYAPQHIIDEFKSITTEYRETLKYTLFKDGNDEDIQPIIEEMYLPDGFKPITGNEKEAKKAIEYLNSRGINETVIADFNLGFIADFSKDNTLKNRVFIPSYDIFNNLTYWVGRDYTGKNKQKVKNPKRSKTEIVFNEGRINWYEPVTLVEGPFDHIATPNSIPLLGKTLTDEYVLYETLKRRLRSEIRIFLDDDAIKNTYTIYKTLEKDEAFKGRVEVVDTPDGYDPALIYQEYGYKGVLDVLCSSHRLNEYDLNGIK